MFIQTEETPNPNALKFLPGVDISPKGPVFFNNFDEARAQSSLAAKLYGVDNVEAVFLGADFITVTKNPQSEWKLLKPEILMVIMDHLVSGLPIFNDNENTCTQINTEGLSEIEKQIIEILDKDIRPSVAMDGGDITFEKYEDGILFLQMKGSCAGCPSSTMTLKMGIENRLRQVIPDLIEVVSV